MDVNSTVPEWILVLGGAGIVLGLGMYGEMGGVWHSMELWVGEGVRERRAGHLPSPHSSDDAADDPPP